MLVFWEFLDVQDFDNKNNILVHLAGSNLNLNKSNNEDFVATKNLSSAFKNRMIFASSASVYGENVKNMATEYSETIPKTEYSKNKILCEKEVLNVNGTVLRLSNVYGKGMSKKSVFYDIVSQIRANKLKLQLYNPLAVRDFISVEDVCDAICKISNNPNKGIFNICTGVGTSVKRLADLIIKYSDLNYSCFSYTSSILTESRLVLDPEFTEKTFDWSSKVSIKKGLKSFLFSKGNK